MGRPILPFALIAAVLSAVALPLALRAQDVFSTTTGGGSAPLQGGVSVTEPAPPGHTRPTGTQGIEGNPDCPPPVMADGTSPKNWSCTTRNQGVVGNPDCPPPVSADGTTPKNWSCRTGTQGVEGNPNCPPPAMPGGMIPRNWSCAGPDMAGDPLSPLRDPGIVADYRGEPGVPPMMRANARTDEEEAAGAVLTCRRAVVEGIERPSQAEMAEYVCDDQSKALDRPPFQLRVEQTVCILPLKGAVEELKAGKMLLIQAQGASGAERDDHAARGNAHLSRAAAKVGQSDDCLVENPPRPAAAQRAPGQSRQPARAAPSPRDIARNPCEPVAGMDPRLRGAVDAKCPMPGKAATQAPPPAPPSPAQPPLQPQTPSEDDCDVAAPPLDIRDRLMDLARQMDRNATEFQNAAMKASNRFLTGMNEVVQQQLVFLAQEPGKPAGQIVDAVVAYLNNDALENHNKLLADAQKAVEDFVKDPAYAAGKFLGNQLIGKVQGAITDRLPMGKFCTIGSRRAAEETRKLEGAVQAAGELDKMAKQATDAADGARACRITPKAAGEDRRFLDALQRKRQEEEQRAAAAAARAKARPQAQEATKRQAAQRKLQQERARQQAEMRKATPAEREKMAAEARLRADAERRAAQQQVDQRRANQAKQIQEQNAAVDQRRRADAERMKAEPPRRPAPATPEEAARQRQAQQAERQRQIAEAQKQNELRRAAPDESRERALIEQQRLAEQRRKAAEDAQRLRRQQAAAGDPRAAGTQPADAGTRQLPAADRPPEAAAPPRGGYGSGSPPPGQGGGQLRPLSQQAAPANPFGQQHNCLAASVAGDLRKKNPGRPYTDSDIRLAGSDELVTPTEATEILEKHYGGLEFDDHTPRRRRAQSLGIPTKVTSSQDLRDELLRGGADSRGIVFIQDKRTGSGHVVRAERDQGRVNFINEQDGTDGTMWAVSIDYTPADFDMFFFRTN